MTRAAETIPTAPTPAAPAVAAAAPSVEQSLNWLKGKLTCPFCGTVTDRPDEACARCGMHDTSANREATKARIGPWYVLQSRNPAAPGMTYATLMLLVKKSLVTARSIVRGPTTHQLWAFAANVRGLSREFGVCWSCAGALEKSALTCGACGQSQKPPASAEDLVERPALEGRADSGLAEEIMGVDSAARASPGAMDIVLPTPGEARRDAEVPRERLSADDTETAGAVARPRTRILSEEQLNSPARRMIYYPTESRWRRVRQGVGVLFLTAAVLLGFALFLFPDFRRTSLYWANDTFAPLMEQWRAWGDSTRPTPVNTLPPFNADGSSTETKVKQHPKPGFEPRRPPGTPPADPTAAPAPPVSLPPPPGSSSSARQASAALVDEMVTQNLIHTLKDSAAAAEAKGDFKGAILYYQQIMAVPPRFWPDDLQQKIDAARAKVPGS